MFALGFACLVLLATTTSQADLPDGLARWFLTEPPPYDLEETFLLEEVYEPEIPPVVDSVRSKTTAAATSNLPLLLQEDVQVTVEEHLDRITTAEEGGVDEAGSVAVWTMVLVVGVLLASVLGSVGVAYYLCVWRGGRIHYQRQKERLLSY